MSKPTVYIRIDHNDKLLSVEFSKGVDVSVTRLPGPDGEPANSYNMSTGRGQDKDLRRFNKDPEHCRSTRRQFTEQEIRDNQQIETYGSLKQAADKFAAQRVTYDSHLRLAKFTGAHGLTQVRMPKTSAEAAARAFGIPFEMENNA